MITTQSQSVLELRYTLARSRLATRTRALTWTITFSVLVFAVLFFTGLLGTHALAWWSAFVLLGSFMTVAFVRYVIAWRQADNAYEAFADVVISNGDAR